MSLLVAALAAGAAAAGFVAPGASALGRVRAPARTAAVATPGAWTRWAGGAALLVVVGLWGGGSLLAGALASAFAFVTAAGLIAKHRERGAAAGRRAAVAESARVLAGLLRVGVVPAKALMSADDCPPLTEARAVQSTGGDVAEALRRSASVPGQEGLYDLAAAWSVSQRTGASLALALDTVASSLSETEDAERTVAIELAAPRAGGRVLGVLPLVGLGLGYLLGGDPLAFLLGNPLGWVCLVLGVGLMCAGLWWSDQIPERPEGRRSWLG